MKCLGAFFASVVLVSGGLSTYSDTCFLPIDLLLVQDTTGSFMDDLPNVSKAIPTLVSSVLENNPGSHFGAVEFKDKPYRDLGEPDDFCYRMASALTGDVATFQKAWDTLYASGGGDLPEVQLQALIDAAQDPTVGWRVIDNSIQSGDDVSSVVGARLIVLSTDAVPHDPLDYDLYLEEPLPEPPLPPSFMPPFPDNSVGVTPDFQCRIYDYPSMAQAANVLKTNNVMVVFLVPEIETDAVAKWSEFNTEYLGQPANFLQYISSDSSDIVQVVLQAVSAVSQYVCF
ncbi:hypothetical protein GNI_097130, partial [Gregarina niphandrodes]